MIQAPVVVISSETSDVGKTTVALNLSAALWSDGYNIRLFAPENEKIQNFLEKRTLLNRQCGGQLPMPTLVNDADWQSNKGKDVVIAIVPSKKNQYYADIFNKAHTLVSVGCQKSDFDWSFKNPYVNLIWQTKKNAAAKGIKQFNWIVVQNKLQKPQDNLHGQLSLSAKQLGFRIAEPIWFRKAYKYAQDGYCAADMAKYRQIFKMSMEDVYARREILNFTDDLWKHK